MSRSLILPTFRGLALVAILVAVTLLALSQSGGSVHASDTTNYVDGTGTCDGLTPCYDTIQEGVDNVTDGGTVNVFPGTYDQGVDLSAGGNVDGGVTLITVGPSGTPTPGTVTINPPADTQPSGVAFYGCDVAGDITIDGFTVSSPMRDPIEFCGNNDITIKNVTANNVGPGDRRGVTLSMDSGNIVIMNSTANGFADDGFELGAGGDVTITNSTANGNGDNGFFIDASGNVTITGSTANDNSSSGVVAIANGDINISGSTASNNTGDWGFDVLAFGDGALAVSNSTANGNASDGFRLDSISPSPGVTVSDSTANGNGDDGFDVRSDGAVTLDRLTAIDNEDDGIDIEPTEGPVKTATVKNSLITANDSAGLDFDDSRFDAAGPATGNIICDNDLDDLDDPTGLDLDADIDPLDATGNWWGSASGPFHPVNNPGGTGSFSQTDFNQTVHDEDTGDSGSVDFDPWVDTVGGNAAVDPVTVGGSTVISFQFSGGAGTVFLGQGPGDPNGPGTFAVTTDNGSVAPSSAFINKPDGTLEVTLTPDTAGNATVTVTGPCDLQGSKTVVVAAVAEVVQQPTPTPTQTPVTLPTSGGTPSAGGSSALPWLAAIAGALALMGAGSGLWLAYQRRRVR